MRSRLRQMEYSASLQSGDRHPDNRGDEREDEPRGRTAHSRFGASRGKSSAWRKGLTVMAVSGALLALSGCDVQSLPGPLKTLVASNSSGGKTRASSQSQSTSRSHNSVQSLLARISGRKPSTTTAKPTGPSAYGGTTFDPQGLFQTYDDSIYVTTSQGYVYVSWISYLHGLSVYASIAKDGQWIVRDKEVYQFPLPKDNGSWQYYLTGNEMYIWDTINDDIRVVGWNHLGETVTNQVLYHGWLYATIPVSTDTGLAAMGHLPYPKYNDKGEHYFIDSIATKQNPLDFAMKTGTFQGDLYAVNQITQMLYETISTPTGGYMVDAYNLGDGQNVQTPSGNLLSYSEASNPEQLLIDKSGHVINDLVSSTNGKKKVKVFVLSPSLKPVQTPKTVTMANPYSQNVAISLAGRAVDVWNVFSYHGQAALQLSQVPY